MSDLLCKPCELLVDGLQKSENPAAGVVGGTVGGAAVGVVHAVVAMKAAGWTVGGVVAVAKVAGVAATAGALGAAAAPFIGVAAAGFGLWGLACGLSNWRRKKS